MTEKNFTPGEMKVMAETGIASVEDVKRMALLLAERDADKKRIEKLSTERANGVETLQSELIQSRIRADAAEKHIAELKRDVDAANARVDTKCAQLCNQDEEIEMLRLRIAELEARTVSVKLPEPATEGGRGYRQKVIWVLKEACFDAGIKLEVGE